MENGQYLKQTQERPEDNSAIGFVFSHAAWAGRSRHLALRWWNAFYEGMAATESRMLPLGTSLPVFSLEECASGQTVSSTSFEGVSALVVIFLCAHCPYVIHVVPELRRLVGDYSGRGVRFVGITSNDPEQYPEDSIEGTAEFASREGLVFPILFDGTQEVAKAVSAACTPDFFVFGQDARLVYRGQLDDSRPRRSVDRPGRGVLNGADVRAALDALLAGERVGAEQRPSIGCGIKWRPGNEPA